MQTTGSRTDRPTTRRAVVLAASLALVVNLLAPMIGGMLSAALADGVWIQICTSDGIEYRRVDFDGETGGETEPAENHFAECQVCAHCSISCGKKVLARAVADWAGPGFADDRVSWVDHPAIHSPAAARGILKRAPPIV